MLALVKGKVISSPLLSVKHIGHLVTVIYLSFVIFSPRGMGTKAFFSIYFSRFLGDSLDGNNPIFKPVIPYFVGMKTFISD